MPGSPSRQSCKSFQTILHSKKVAIIRMNRLCLNCLRPGHFVRQCSSSHGWKVCQGPHHSLLHIDQSHKRKLNRSRSSSPDNRQWKVVTTHTSNLSSHNKVFHLPPSHRGPKVSGIGDGAMQSNHGTVNSTMYCSRDFDKEHLAIHLRMLPDVIKQYNSSSGFVIKKVTSLRYEMS